MSGEYSTSKPTALHVVVGRYSDGSGYELLSAHYDEAKANEVADLLRLAQSSYEIEVKPVWLRRGL